MCGYKTTTVYRRSGRHWELSSKTSWVRILCCDLGQVCSRYVAAFTNSATLDAFRRSGDGIQLDKSDRE